MSALGDTKSVILDDESESKPKRQLESNLEGLLHYTLFFFVYHNLDVCTILEVAI